MKRIVPLVVAGTLTALLLAEAFLAIARPQVIRLPRVWQYDSELGWSNQPNAVGRLVSPEFDVEFRINEAGLRGPEVARRKPAGTRRVALLGDSFAQGWGVAEADSLRARLEALLRAQGGGPVEVLSFGVAGYGTDQALLMLRERARSFGPDVVVLVAYGNDLWDNGSPTGNGGGWRHVPRPHFQAESGGLRLLGSPVARSPYWDEPRFPSRGWLMRQGARSARYSHLAALVSRALRTTEAVQIFPAAYYERIYARRPDAAARAAWKLTGLLVGACVSETRAAGARFVLMYASDRSEVDPEERRAPELRLSAGAPGELSADVPNAAFAQMAAAHDIEFVDLRAAMLAAPDAGPYFFEERHWNERGHALAARAVAAILAP
jgi:hypothetical protein